MITQKYFEDLKRCSNIAESLEVRWGHNQRGVLAKLYSEATGLSVSTSRGHVCDYITSGPSATQCSSGARLPRKYHLDRFSLFCEILSMPSDDLVVRLMKEVNSNFEYPLPEKHSARSHA